MSKEDFRLNRWRSQCFQSDQLKVDIFQLFSLLICGGVSRIEATITDHLRDSPLDSEKYKVVQISPIQEDRNQEDCKKKFKKIGNFIP